ncbi:NADPH oxidoreductase A-like [Ruditapes philippinarum]|uniref:NADPH oxidoreductase A-like n=1 Tax=Ruditapes philippinarum TaxID=129788 RepID=UPI00295BB599|nr:NADPH oxidoreductase A-like [Ruditapes philippinarum]
MMYYVAFIVPILTVFYLYRLLTSSSGSEFTDNSIDAFISDDAVEKKDEPKERSNKYKKDYTVEGRQILILYGTEYGCSEEIAKLLYDRIKDLNAVNSELCLQPRVINIRDYQMLDFSREQLCFIVISTSGDGVPPTEARPFYEHLLSTDIPVDHLKFSLLALGDSNYPQFCKTGRTVHERMLHLGADSVIDRQDVDMEDWSVINKWIDSVTVYIPSASLNISLDYIQHKHISEELFSRNTPFMAILKTKRLLTVCDGENDKETIHCEFDITGSGLTWTSGDALGIYPQNNPSEVNYLIQCMHCTGNEKVTKPSWAYQQNDDTTECESTLTSILTKYYDLKSVKLELLKALKFNVTESEERTKIDNLINKDTSQASEHVQNYLKEREVADVLADFKSHSLPVTDLLKCMKSLQPRYYSISSSPKKNCNKVCVTAAVVRYKTLGRPRTGVTTTFLNDRCEIDDCCPIFMSRNPDFRLPADSQIPIILIGPGTGIAPFIAFIQEREMEASSAATWLYFGCRHKDKDYLYKSQLEKWNLDGTIRLSVAFSRDQDQKIYVQDLLQRDAEEIWRLINKENASIFVCGDAKHMAHDVHLTLTNIVTEKGSLDKSKAAIYLKEMEENSRYEKDVWVV